MLEKSLPSEYYLSGEIFEKERDRIFSREWVCAGRAEDLPEAGGVRILEILGESLLIIRAKEGRLAAHYNVCRHRGARLCAADGDGSPGETSGTDTLTKRLAVDVQSAFFPYEKVEGLALLRNDLWVNLDNDGGLVTPRFVNTGRFHDPFER